MYVVENPPRHPSTTRPSCRNAVWASAWITGPASAGEPCDPSDAAAGGPGGGNFWGPAHPHARGDRWLHQASWASLVGSPPRAWGRHPSRSYPRRPSAVHPTRVGRRLVFSDCRWYRRFTPSAWGRRRWNSGSGGATHGSPPRAWDGPGRSCSRHRARPVHPHARGDGIPAGLYPPPASRPWTSITAAPARDGRCPGGRRQIVQRSPRGGS